MPNYNKANAEIYGKQMLCRCPKCNAYHHTRIRWIGRAKFPPIYCDNCLVVTWMNTSGLDEAGEYHKHAAITMARGG